MFPSRFPSLSSVHTSFIKTVFFPFRLFANYHLNIVVLYCKFIAYVIHAYYIMKKKTRD